ncbi:hypothetical protein PV326_011461, partial [Microctonus aethiopoides]
LLLGLLFWKLNKDNSFNNGFKLVYSGYSVGTKMEVRAMEYRPIVPTGVAVPGIQDYHAAIPDLSPPRSQGSSTGGASSIGDYAPRMYTPPTPPTPHEDEK